ncbi:MAG: hypothetical protein COV74_01295 [Candidatus Omnitrophica bacterium CG11_big_fil_rev_8_21_14_0_20_45_26]|uniref:Uncharacterized protein n=1 Tax=Candidatus Abzuiibacterium crystallinum TaxID=1974748 RepID=A0A2H0LUL3_9BACT|nr:MAG: hypothetical protein COV74_01295 [Candidatus Omnitrophica bacterium CG11_big_fil_rev_8_21_14_0_20_45_26]PIW64805.1 MAG: hypothetical protein COW12_04705 [Candidatus Omnitrophica bacterium CG12_big_fil_rev_8_21_14_0_65_45_16]
MPEAKNLSLPSRVSLRSKRGASCRAFHTRVLIKQKRIFALILILAIGFGFAHSAGATIPTFDAANAALNELRNAILESQFAQVIGYALEQVNQLEEEYLEIIRFHSGFDYFLDVFVGDPLARLWERGYDELWGAFQDFGWVMPEIEIMGTSTAPEDIRSALQAVTGEIPPSEDRPYIPFEEVQVVSGFQLAQEIREAGEEARRAAEDISAQAKTASPKGALRLQAEALSQIILLEQQNQEAMAKVLELQATKIEQVSRDEKRLESERVKFLDDAGHYLETVLTVT